jgi:hypothetical protein
MASAETFVKKANDAKKWATQPATSFTVDGLLNEIDGVESEETFDVLLEKLAGKVEDMLK